MKKFIAIASVLVMMLMMCTVSAFAEISPSAKPSTDSSSGSSTSPQTSDNAIAFGSFALLMSAAAGITAVKKIKE